MTTHSLPIPFDMIPEPGEELGDIGFEDLMTPLLLQALGLARIAHHGVAEAVVDQLEDTAPVEHALMLLADILALACSTFKQWKDEAGHGGQARTNGAKTTA